MKGNKLSAAGLTTLTTARYPVLAPLNRNALGVLVADEGLVEHDGGDQTVAAIADED
jgi:hypothetical protein